MNAASITIDRPPVTKRQELRKFTGEALRESIPWACHPAWTVHALRELEGKTNRVGISPPPAFTPSDIRGMITGVDSLRTCAHCGHRP